MKTIRTWYKSLPEPQRTQALKNLCPSAGKVKVRDIYNALLGGFDWESSPEGGEYWWKFTDEYDKDITSIVKNITKRLRTL